MERTNVFIFVWYILTAVCDMHIQAVLKLTMCRAKLQLQYCPELCHDAGLTTVCFPQAITKQFGKLTIKLAHQKWPGITERQRMNYVWNRIQVSTVEFSNATWKSYLDIYRRWNNTTQRIFHWVKKSLALFLLSCVLNFQQSHFCSSKETFN